MSTKTTLKRVALVAVAALGFGVLTSVAPASAYAGSMSVSTTSLTVVQGAGNATTGNAGFFYVDIFDQAGDAAALMTSESITVSVVGKPAKQANGTSDTTLADLTIGTAVRGSIGAVFAAVTGAQAAQTTSNQIPNGSALATAFASSNLTSVSATVGATSNRYYFGVYPTNSNALDAGEYTLRVRLFDANSFTTDTTLKVKFVASAADSGAKIAVTTTGTFNKGGAIAYTAAQNIKATLTDANGGRLVTGTTMTGDINTTTPVLSANIVDALGVVKDALTPSDEGIAGADMVASTSTLSGGITNYALSQEANGVYGLTAASIASAAAAVDNVVRVRYGSTSTSVALSTLATSTAIDKLTDLTLTATGVLAADQLIKTNVETTTAYTLPTTATSAKLRISIDTASGDATDQPMTVKTTWSGNYATASVSPATTTTTTSNTDSSGNIDLAITNSTPLAGAVATITITGYGYTAGSSRGPVAGSTIVTLTWAAPVATTVTVLDPVASVKVKAGSTNVLTVRVRDQFGTNMAGQAVQPSLSSTSSNYSATTTFAAITTGADGTATLSHTDVKAADAKSDAFTFSSVSNSAATPGTFTLSYVTTLPAAASVTGYYNNDWNTAVASVNTLIPSTGIYSSAGTGVKVAIANTRDISKSLAAHDDLTTDDMVVVRFRAVDSTGAAATGAAVTITAPTGGHIVGAAGTPVSTRTVAVNADGDVSFQILATAPGALTWTIASGTVSTSVSVWVATPTEAAGRTVAITGATTATANGEGIPMTVTVKDRYGNAVTGVNLTLSASGAAAFAGGATTQSFQTDATGTYTFMAKSFVAAGGAGTYKVSAGNATDSASPAGYSLGVEVDSTLAAGISSATATVTFGAGEDPAAANAQAATDAAAEATDAANAATDAANAAAEAADAATAAAQDAADAVAALSTQVSEMVNALKKQITALTNLVIKIQKKVRA
jgi:trimeric autotransporter adhesin